uniref:Uncharacterized protein n=1 Tax=Physcomitrium patens TaxID=3218 RepID=A0A2K1IU32_PHYPA|nr:hypothetical protein PHYPA_024710 [Physcomitrium patens]
MLGPGACGPSAPVTHGTATATTVFFFPKTGARLLKMDAKKGKANPARLRSFDVIAGFILLWYMVYGHAPCPPALCSARNCRT